MFFKNITGLYLFEKLRDELAGTVNATHKEADAMTMEAAVQYFINVAAYDLDSITVLDTTVTTLRNRTRTTRDSR